MDQFLSMMLIVGATLIVGMPLVLTIQDDLDESVRSFKDFSDQAERRLAQQISVTYIDFIDKTTGGMDSSSDKYAEIHMTNTGLVDIDFFAVLVNGNQMTLTSVTIGESRNDPDITLDIDPKFDPDDSVVLKIHHTDLKTNMVNLEWKHKCDPLPPEEPINFQIVSKAGSLFTIEVGRC